MITDCIFCKIVAKEIPNYTIYENDRVLAFLDIHPHAKGHTVVIPKRHAETVFELDDAEVEALSLGMKRAMERIKNVLKPDGFNTGWNDGTAAGQVVPHVHIHIFPRWRTDGGGSMHSIIRNPGGVTPADIAKLFA
jgi:histidine triad (HIT) family protein